MKISPFNFRESFNKWELFFLILNLIFILYWSIVDFFGFPDSSLSKESACNAGDPGSIPGLGRSTGERKGYPLQYSGLGNSMDCTVLGIAKSQTELSDVHSLTYS